jgi:KDO2-lipid IV(A) lauroyltransferase
LSDRLQRVVNSEFGVSLALGLGRTVPPRLGYPLARFVADRIAGRPTVEMVKVVRANQWVVHGAQASEQQLDCAVRETFRHTARCIYDLYHNQSSKEAMLRLIDITPDVAAMIERTRSRREGTMIVGVHMSNFDMVLQAAGMYGLDVQGISQPQPEGGYRLQNALRRQHGLEITPASVASLKRAVERLRAGGSVLTGLDRPNPDGKYRPNFFGRPASLPVHHIYLAMKAQVPVYVFAATFGADGRYHIHAAGPILMRPYDDHRTAVERNAEAVLQVAENFIRQAPQQWSMFFPVWPEALQEIQ